MFLLGETDVAKRYLQFLLQRIEIQGNEVRLEANVANLLSPELHKTKAGTVNHEASVPTLVLDWLPGPEKTRTSCPALDVPLFVALTSFGNGRLSVPRLRHAFAAEDLIIPPAPLRLPKEAPVQRARRFQAMLDNGEARNRAEVARLLGCSRAWVTKVLGSGGTGAA